jgi:prevent-host-death family protein
MSSKTVNIHEAKTHLSELLALAMQGEEIIIAKANRPLVRLTPLEPPKKGRKTGLHEGIYWTSDDFDEPLPEDFFSDPSP